MAMNRPPKPAQRTATPWWLSLIHLLFLSFLFLAERFLDLNPDAQAIVRWVSVVAVVGVTVVRVIATVRTTGGRRRVERSLLLASLGTLLAIGFFALSTQTGRDLVGVGAEGARRFDVAMMVLTGIVAAASVLPIIMIEATLGAARREHVDLRSVAGDDGSVEYRRVRELGLSGLSLALAASFLMVTCGVAREKDWRESYGYFRTSSPGGSTQNILRNTTEPVTVLLFFPAVNEVKDEVRGYFNQLAKATGKVSIEEHEIVTNPALARKHGVTQDGAIVLVRGEGEDAKSEKIPMSTDMKTASRPSKSTTVTRPTLRTLDGAVNAALLKLVRDKRKVYLTVGHGEINDPESIDPALREKLPDARATVIKAVLQNQNYEVKNLGAMEGLDGGEIPDDATAVVILGPRVAFLEEELATLDRYVARGGHLLIALDPMGDAALGPLEQRLGVRFDKAMILDDRDFDNQRGPRVPITNQFSSHASVTSLSKASSDVGLRLLGTGSLEEVDFAGGDGEKPTRTHVIRTMTSSFRDVDGDGKLTDGSEKRDRYIVASAIEGPKTADGGDGFRALVFADAELFVDRPVQQAGQMFLTAWGGPMIADAVRWVGGEEVFGGDIQVENDVEIEQTKKQQSWWFFLMTIGVPFLVLGIGLVVSRTRRPAARTAPVSTPATKEDAR